MDGDNVRNADTKRHGDVESWRPGVILSFHTRAGTSCHAIMLGRHPVYHVCLFMLPCICTFEASMEKEEASTSIRICVQSYRPDLVMTAAGFSYMTISCPRLATRNNQEIKEKNLMGGHSFWDFYSSRSVLYSLSDRPRPGFPWEGQNRRSSLEERPKLQCLFWSVLMTSPAHLMTGLGLPSLASRMMQGAVHVEESRVFKLRHFLG